MEILPGPCAISQKKRTPHIALAMHMECVALWKAITMIKLVTTSIVYTMTNAIGFEAPNNYVLQGKRYI